MVFVMLNPSIADDQQDDPTVRKCMGFAAANGCNSIVIANLFAFVSPYPAALLEVDDPIGIQADDYLSRAVQITQSDQADLVAAWGSQPRLRDALRPRVDLFEQICRTFSVTPLCLGVNRDGSPRHPARLGYDTPLEPWRLPS